jgi:protein-disulfide isomerase
MTSLPRRASADLAALLRSPLALALAAALGAGAFALFSMFPREAHAATIAPEPVETAQVELLTEQEKANFLKQYEALPKVTVPIDAGGAKVLVVKFNDYQCPPCRQSYMQYKWAIAKYEALGQLKFVLKHFPLERECNAAVSTDLHVASCEAAAAVVMAQSKGTADKLEEWLFANQPSLTPERVKEGAATVGGITDFDAQYARALTLVKTDAGLGALLGAKSTPTFLVNGRVIAGALPPAYFELAIEHELKR